MVKVVVCACLLRRHRMRRGVLLAHGYRLDVVDESGEDAELQRSRYVSTRAWRGHRKGEDLILTVCELLVHNVIRGEQATGLEVGRGLEQAVYARE